MVLRLTTVLGAAIAAGASAAELATSSRAFVAKDLVGEYKRFLAFPGSEELCPTEIHQDMYMPNPEDPSNSTYLVPHASIMHDDTACSNDGMTLVMPLAAALDNSAFSDALAADPTGQVSAAVQNVLDGSDSMFGYDPAGRSCGDAVSLPPNTAYLFVHEMKKNVTLIPDVAELPMGSRYMALFSMTADQDVIACLYMAEHEDHDGHDHDEHDHDDHDDKDDKDHDDDEDHEDHEDHDHDEDHDEDAEAKEAETTEEKDAACFPADASVTLESGDVVPMSTLRVGDSVAVGAGRFSAVFGFTHADAEVRTTFVQLTTSSGATLSASAGHYVHVSGGLTAARDVRVGDVLELADGAQDAVTSVGSVTRTGLYNPQTVDGSIVVDGVRASTYTEAVEPTLAHAALAPVRALFSFFGVAPLSLKNGADAVANVLPSGQGLVQ